MFDGISGLESSHLMEHSQLSGIHPFMSAESINLDDIAVCFTVLYMLFNSYNYQPVASTFCTLEENL